MVRIQSHIWVSAILRRAQAAGAFATLLHKGADAAGAIFVCVNDMAGRNLLLGPAPQVSYDADDLERRFQPLLEDADSDQVRDKLDREKSFDPDIWIIEIEDREMRSFIEDELVVKP
ncbi:MAG: DUF1491 family protein [Pseudomonadota bacterium]